MLLELHPLRARRVDASRVTSWNTFDFWGPQTQFIHGPLKEQILIPEIYTFPRILLKPHNNNK